MPTAEGGDTQSGYSCTVSRLSQFVASLSRSLLLLKSRLASQLPVDEFRLRMGCR